MKKLFEVSIRGSLYFYLSTISEQQVSQLQQFANQFYRSNSAYKYRADDEIMACFTISVKQKFDIELERIPVTAACYQVVSNSSLVKSNASARILPENFLYWLDVYGKPFFEKSIDSFLKQLL